MIAEFSINGKPKCAVPYAGSVIQILAAIEAQTGAYFEDCFEFDLDECAAALADGSPYSITSLDKTETYVITPY